MRADQRAADLRPDLHAGAFGSDRNLDKREFIGTIGLLIVGGNDTTRNSMTGGLMALVENPEQFELLRRGAS